MSIKWFNCPFARPSFHWSGFKAANQQKNLILWCKQILFIQGACDDANWTLFNQFWLCKLSLVWNIQIWSKDYSFNFLARTCVPQSRCWESLVYLFSRAIYWFRVRKFLSGSLEIILWYLAICNYVKINTEIKIVNIKFLQKR